MPASIWHHGFPTVRSKPRSSPWVELHTCPKAHRRRDFRRYSTSCSVDDIVAWPLHLKDETADVPRCVPGCQRSKRIVCKCITDCSVLSRPLKVLHCASWQVRCNRWSDVIAHGFAESSAADKGNIRRGIQALICWVKRVGSGCLDSTVRRRTVWGVPSHRLDVPR